MDISSGTWQTFGHISVSMGADSLLIVPAGFNTSTAFADYSTLGVTYTRGTTLTVPAGLGFVGSVSIKDPVPCQGSIVASGGNINLNDGLVLSGSGSVTLGGGNLTVNDNLSGISGGSLSVYNQYTGSGGTGTFTQSGGINGIGNYLYLGNNAGDSGTYKLSGGSSQLFASAEYVGFSGTGTFTQSGGTNNSSGYLYLGGNVGGSGDVQPQRQQPPVTANAEYVGSSGTGAFTQSGGTNLIGSALYLGATPAAAAHTASWAAAKSSAPPNTWALRARGPSRSPAGPTIAAVISISAAMPAGHPVLRVSAHTASAAAAGFWPPRNTWATFRCVRDYSSRPAAPTPPPRSRSATSGSYLLAGGALAGQRQPGQPGDLLRRHRGGNPRRQRNLGSHQRHLAETSATSP